MAQLSVWQILIKRIVIQLIWIVFLILSNSCNNISNEEKVALEQLNKTFSNYEFQAAKDVIGIHLEVVIKGAKVDTLELIDIYKATIESDNSPSISWVYLTVYDSCKNYLFTVSKSKNQFDFFQDSYK
jgi:hypothetical protein